MARDRSWSPWPVHRLAILAGIAGLLAAGALFGLASTVGIQKALTRLVHPSWPWLVIAVGGELVAYAGYTAAYREVARVEDGAELKVPKAAALVAAGFGVFVHGGGFALDRMALRRAGLSEGTRGGAFWAWGHWNTRFSRRAHSRPRSSSSSGIRRSAPVSPCPGSSALRSGLSSRR